VALTLLLECCSSLNRAKSIMENEHSCCFCNCSQKAEQVLIHSCRKKGGKIDPSGSEFPLQYVEEWMRAWDIHVWT
jgi:hypothetical protein